MSHTSANLLYQQVNCTDDLIETIGEMKIKTSRYQYPSIQGTTALINLLVNFINFVSQYKVTLQLYYFDAKLENGQQTHKHKKSTAD